MNKTWLTIEKVIAIALVAWGIAALYSITTTVIQIVETGLAKANHTTYLQLFEAHHLNFFLALGIIFG
jgi:hypothetical protein